jgi:hypothetical protein
LEAAAAHKIQKEMALAYFNFFILGDQAGLDTLQANPWSPLGARLQIHQPDVN